jgi:predicted nucleic acid-binding protein
MKLLIDTNIILDIALQREPFYDDSASIFKKINRETTFGFVTATTITDIYYSAKKDRGHSIAIEFVSSLVQVIEIIGVDKQIILEALASKLLDFKDSIQSVASGFNGLDFTITRNIRDFEESSVKALTPGEFLNLSKKKNGSTGNLVKSLQLA